MSALTPASEALLRHSDDFTTSRILFAGDLQDDVPTQFDAPLVRVHCHQYHHWQMLRGRLGENAHFGLLTEPELFADIDTLIYFWPKSKQEARFQLWQLLANLPAQTDVFIIGENRSGVRSAETMLEDYCPMQKIDSARRCGLYHGKLTQAPEFSLDEWWQTYHIGNTCVKTLPGVFSADGLDNGSQLLLNTFSQPIKGKVLDIASGAGVLAAILASQSPQMKLTLTDVNAAALEASKATLLANQLTGEVKASNVYSDIPGRFDMIISNPPFHDGLQTSLQAAEGMIRGAAAHLHPGGKLRIVANAFLPYPDWLDATFGSHEVLAQNGRFKVYQATLGRPRKN
jgi:16S rRNA (guanine1207-N2)-methyltransferase